MVPGIVAGAVDILPVDDMIVRTVEVALGHNVMGEWQHTAGDRY